MAEILATKTSLLGGEVPGTFEAIRAEALFLSALQPSGAALPRPGPPRRRDEAAAAGSPRLRRTGDQRVR